ncbi:MAG: hypothetical protein JWR26_322 [Pedosphaera sp.]|nr:hypothetical protein [Pedosphaera sp.]
MITSEGISIKDRTWPALPLADWQDTCATLHMWSQIVGKVRLALSPLVNHWWEVPFYVSGRGLTTSPIPYGAEDFEVRFDFIDHSLDIETSWGETMRTQLVPCTVADFYNEFMQMLRSLGIDVKIWPMPVEIPDPIPFGQDRLHASYDPEYAHRFWRILVTVDGILKEFRAGFVGKCSPVHFFWGSFDLCVTRFSGRRAPERPGADRITKEAYSHEVSSAGFWPGGGDINGAAFYSYASPEPSGFRESSIRPANAFYHPKLHEFVLMYEDVRATESPREALMQFLQTTYDAAATLGRWDRKELERQDWNPQSERNSAGVGVGAR